VPHLGLGPREAALELFGAASDVALALGVVGEGPRRADAGAVGCCGGGIVAFVLPLAVGVWRGRRRRSLGGVVWTKRGKRRERGQEGREGKEEERVRRKKILSSSTEKEKKESSRSISSFMLFHRLKP